MVRLAHPSENQRKESADDTRFERMLLAMSAGSPCTIIGKGDTTPKLSPRLEQMLDWLPVDTETLIVANGPFQISRKASETSAFQELLQSLLRCPGHRASGRVASKAVAGAQDSSRHRGKSTLQVAQKAWHDAVRGMPIAPIR